MREPLQSNRGKRTLDDLASLPPLHKHLWAVPSFDGDTLGRFFKSAASESCANRRVGCIRDAGELPSSRRCGRTLDWCETLRASARIDEAERHKTRGARVSVQGGLRRSTFAAMACWFVVSSGGPRDFFFPSPFARYDGSQVALAERPGYNATRIR